MGSMIKIFLTLSIALQLNLSAFHTSIYKAIGEAQQRNKPIAYFIISNTCPHCHKLMDNISNDANLGNFIQQNFVLVISDIKRGEKVPSNLPFTGEVPTFMVVNTNGEIIGKPLKGKISNEILGKYLSYVAEWWKTEHHQLK